MRIGLLMRVPIDRHILLRRRNPRRSRPQRSCPILPRTLRSFSRGLLFVPPCSGSSKNSLTTTIACNLGYVYGNLTAVSTSVSTSTSSSCVSSDGSTASLYTCECCEFSWPLSKSALSTLFCLLYSLIPCPVYSMHALNPTSP
jgi:hypothetical protein